jgi:glycosyltransferase involved in cell wall biosynthesis
VNSLFPLALFAQVIGRFGAHATNCCHGFAVQAVQAADGITRHMDGVVAYLTGEYPKVSHTFIQREIAALRAQGVRVVTCTIRRAGPRDVLVDQRAEEDATFSVLGAARNPVTLVRAHWGVLRHRPGAWFAALRLALTTGSPGVRAFLWQMFYFIEAAVLARHLRAQEVVHLHNHFSDSSCSVAMLASEMSGIPFSFTMHGPDIFYQPYRWRIDAKIARARFVACISHFCRSQAMLFSDQRHWGKLHIVHCGIDPAKYDAPSTATGHASGGHLLFVGRLAAVKGVPVLFAALENARARGVDLRLTLIGDGAERQTLESAARALGNDVTFAGYRTQAEVAAALQGADALVLPSFAEGLPVVLMEAMAARVPVVTTRIAGVPELVEDGVSGLLVAPGDVDGLAEALVAVMADPARRRAMGEAGRAKVVTEFDGAAEAAWLARLFAGAEGLPVRP